MTILPPVKKKELKVYIGIWSTGDWSHGLVSWIGLMDSSHGALQVFQPLPSSGWSRGKPYIGH